jgi:hypothetical protein
MSPVHLVSFVLATTALAAAVAGAAPPLPENSTSHPKLVYRQLGGGCWLAQEVGRTDGAFFVCRPNKTECIGTTEIGWKKPFIIYRSGALFTPSYSVIDTRTRKPEKWGKPLESVPRYPAKVAWDKLSATRPLW